MEIWEAREFENSNKVVEQIDADRRTVRILVSDGIAQSFIAHVGYADVDMPLHIPSSGARTH